MGQRTVRYSDLSGKLILDDAEVVKLRVIEHPALTGRPVQLEATPADLLTGVQATRSRTAQVVDNHARHVSKKDYTDVRYAGQVKRGIVSDGEKRTVREFFDEVNSNLRAAGQREIDLSNAEHVDKYGLHELARERNLLPIVDLESNVEDGP